jgi:hypothetical protein
MENGLMTIEKTGEKMSAVFIDQEVLECARLNLRTEKRIRNQKREQTKKMRYEKCMKKSANRILAEAGIGGAVAAFGFNGMIHPLLWVPASMICVCVACLHFGAWLGKVSKA